MEPAGHRRPAHHRLRQLLVRLQRPADRRGDRVRPGEPEEVLRPVRREVLREHRQRRDLHRHRGHRAAQRQREAQGAARRRGRRVGRGRQRQHLRAVALHELRRVLHQAVRRAGGRHHRLRQGRPRRVLPGAVHQREDRRCPRHLPLHRRGCELGADQRQRPPVRGHQHRHHRRPAGLRPGVRGDQRPRHHLRRHLGQLRRYDAADHPADDTSDDSPHHASHDTSDDSPHHTAHHASDDSARHRGVHGRLRDHQQLAGRLPGLRHRDQQGQFRGEQLEARLDVHGGRDDQLAVERGLHAERGGRVGHRAELGDLDSGGRQRDVRLRRHRHRDRGRARRVHAERSRVHQGLSPAGAWQPHS
ncbi:hypothetical protein SCOCK_410056 [Actinacidiphila cocklensis]|uniref:Uncharacterized protein n=1 Tax=Actinacidiphila cocklensis TaxID=887465 RepID=A0A9W4DVZ7_9ACTN|nr:hypothetical protein SCOCK_410056 [Actinacidiphila cocklensis]